MRLRAWICKQWKILPSSPDFQNLTDEQITWLWEDYLLDNPEIQRKIDLANDEEFEKEWEELDKEEADDSFDEYQDVAEKVKEIHEEEKEEVERSKEATRILEELDNKTTFVNKDWEEELEDDDDEWEVSD